MITHGMGPLTLEGVEGTKIRVVPVKLDGKTFHDNWSFSHHSVITSLKCIKWSNGSLDPSNI